MSLGDAFLLEPYPLDVWIALRADGAKGSGTENDPYNGSVRYESAVAVTSITRAGREATVTTATSHGYSDAQVVTISGATGSDSQFYNGTFVIYGVTTATTFKYWMAGAPAGPASGSLACARTVYRFDEVMKMLYDRPAPNTAIHLGPGEFLTRGYMEGGEVRILSGQKIIGSGMKQTTLKLVNASTVHTKYAVIGAPRAGANIEHFEVSDLTLDCNLDGQLIVNTEFPPIACGGIFVSGAHLRYRRVRAIHFGTLEPPEPNHLECFVLWSAGASVGAPESVDCVIEDCIVEQPAINQAWLTTCINMGAGEKDGDPPYPPDAGVMAYHRACVIRNCLIDCEFQFNPVPTTQITYVGNVATVTTAVPHGRAANSWVRIAGVLVDGSLINYFNGAFQVSNPSSTQFQYTMGGTPTGTPTGEMWVDRFSSQVALITNIQKSPTGPPYTITVTTATPHFRIPGNSVIVSEVTLAALNGLFTVKSVIDHTHFTYELQNDPGTITPGASGLIGVYFQAVSNNGGHSAVVEGNRILNVRTGGPYHDFWTSRDVIIRNNYYRNVVNGPFQSMGGNTNPIELESVTYGIPDDFTATLTTVAPHGFTVGQAVKIDGVKVNNGQEPDPGTYNGHYKIVSVLSDDTFTYRMIANPHAQGDAGTGKVFALWETGRWMIENNLIELLPNKMGWGLRYGILMRIYEFGDSEFATVDPRVFRQLVIRNNVIRNADGLPDPDSLNTGISLGYCENALVENNVIDVAIANPIVASACTNLRFFNNRNAAGQLIQGMAGTTRQDELTTFIEDVAIRAML